MVVAVESSRDVFAGNGSTTAFPTTFKFFVPGDIVVTLVDTTTLIETVQTGGGVQYTVTGGDPITPAVGTITFVTAPPTGNNVVVERILTYTQGIDYQPNDPFPAEVNEGGLDRNTFLSQQNNDKLLRVPLLPVDFTGTQPRLPVPVDEQFLVGNDAGTGWEGRGAASLGALPLPVGIPNGGTGAATAVAGFDNLAPTTTKGDIIAHNGTDNVRLPVGFDGQVIQADSADPTGLSFITSAGGPSLGSESILRTSDRNIQENITVNNHSTTFTADAGADTLDVGTDDGFANGDIVQVTTSAADLPAPLTIATDYYVVGVTATTLQLALTRGGAAINITDAGTGTHTIYQTINAMSIGPTIVETGFTVTVPEGSSYTVV